MVKFLLHFWHRKSFHRLQPTKCCTTGAITLPLLIEILHFTHLRWSYYNASEVVVLTSHETDQGEHVNLG